MSEAGRFGDKCASLINRALDAICVLLAVLGDVAPDVEDVRLRQRRERKRSSSGCAVFVPVIFQLLNFPSRLNSVNQLAAFRLLESFFDVGRQRPPLRIGPAFLGILRFERTPERFFHAVISTAGKSLLD